MKKLLIILLAVSFALFFVMCGPKPVDDPTFDPADGSLVNPGDEITINCTTPEASIYYTTDGTDPADGVGTLYSDTTKPKINQATTLKAIAVKAEMAPSNIVSAAYTVKVATPAFNPNGGDIVYGSTVTITCATTGASIYYTTDGSTPSEASTLYSATAKPAITASGTVLKAIAYKTGFVASEVATSTAFNLANVTLTVNITGNGTVGVTVNGTPATGSSPYSILSGSDVVLTATAGTDQFIAWGGDASGSNTTVTIENINGNKTVSAFFATLAGASALIVQVPVNIWGDSSGYEFLLDDDDEMVSATLALPFGTTWNTTNCQSLYNTYNDIVPIYTTFPTSSGGPFEDALFIIPAGTYDMVVMNPTNATGWDGTDFITPPTAGSTSTNPTYIAGQGKFDSAEFEANKIYLMVITGNTTSGETILFGLNDRVAGVSYGTTTIDDENTTPQAIGEVMNGIPFNFTLKNNGVLDLTISAVNFTNTATLTMTPVTTPVVIPGKGSINLTFTTTADVTDSGLISIVSDDSTSPFEFRFSCTLVPPLTLPFLEDFESVTPPAIPNFWTLENIVGTSPTWITEANSGVGNSRSLKYPYQYGTTGNKQRIILREFDMSSTTQDAHLLFALRQPPYSTPPVCEEIRIFVKIGAAGTWTQLAEFITPISTYTYQDVTLTGTSGQSSVYIAFEGTNRYALHAFIDNINVLQSVDPEIEIDGIVDGGTKAVSADATDSITTDYTITIQNLGSGSLNLTSTPDPVIIEVGGDPRITILTQPSAEVSPFGTAPFTVRFTGNGTTTPASANFTIANNDADENPYNFTLTVTPVAFTNVVIGSGTEVGHYLPVDDYWRYVYTQQIYLKSEIGDQVNKKIDGLKIQVQTENATAWVTGVTIYIGHTTKSAFASTTDWETIGNLTAVWTGDIDVGGVASGTWITFTFTTSYDYNNTDNLVIAFRQSNGDYGSNHSGFAGTATPGVVRGLYAYTTTGVIDPATPPTGTNKEVFPNVTLLLSDQ